ncbi:hypothetical protein K474DRAFT_1479 [Panus rudis PR-1116 ss-1]|nr:hypothetical protein K474DRAFT_1479 [Panus rudis PR-1116 ss-1]
MIRRRQSHLCSRRSSKLSKTHFVRLSPTHTTGGDPSYESARRTVIFLCGNLSMTTFVVNLEAEVLRSNRSRTERARHTGSYRSPHGDSYEVLMSGCSNIQAWCKMRSHLVADTAGERFGGSCFLENEKT